MRALERAAAVERHSPLAARHKQSEQLVQADLEERVSHVHARSLAYRRE